MSPRTDFIESSGKFTTYPSKAFLKRTDLPINLLQLCAECLAQKNRTVSNKRVSNTLRMNREKRKALLRLVPEERKILRKEMDRFKNNRAIIHRSILAAKTVIDWIGPQHWESFMEDSAGTYDDIGICPNHKCRTLIFKWSGCHHMRCHCGREFHWEDANLEMDVLNAYHKVSNRTTEYDDEVVTKYTFQYTKFVLSEFDFRRRLLETAHEIIVSSLVARKRQRPIVNMEDDDEIIESIRCTNHYLWSSSLPCIQEENNDKNVIDEEDARDGCNSLLRETETDSLFLMEAMEDLSFSTYTTTSTSSDIDSLCDYIVVAGNDTGDGTFLSSVPPSDQDWEEDFSYSFLSGCDTVHSLDDDVNSMEVGATNEMVLSYCKVVKLGNSALSKIAKEADPVKTRPTINLNSNKKEYSMTNTCSDDINNENNHDSDNDVLLSLYDAAKSCHGGRVSSRFRGNSRTAFQNQLGNYRRGNWSRKKERIANSLS